MKTPTKRGKNWIEVRARLREVEAGLSGSAAPAQQAIDEVYRRRAALLAARQVSATRSATLAVLVFALGAERYAIELSGLAEVLPYKGCIAVPGAPAGLLGVINVRGEIKSVVDLRRVLDLPAADEPEGGYVLLLRDQDRTIGFRVDRVDQVQSIDPARLSSVRDAAAPVQGSRFIKALTADALILLDTGAAVSQFIRSNA